MATNSVSSCTTKAPAATATRRSADAVLAELARARMSGRSLAAELQWSHGQLQRRLRPLNPVPFSVDELDAIARALAVPLSRLVVDAPPSADSDVPRARTG